MKQPINIVVNQDTPAMVAWLAACSAMCDGYMAQHYPTLPKETIEPNWGTRYCRIDKVERNTGADAHVRPFNRRSAWAFIDRSTGDVLKPATFKAPAKHARGNIFDDKGGMGSMSNYGPAYLR